MARKTRPANARLYEQLGVATDASPADIKAAYRRRAKKAHPDAGGSAEEFEALSRAHRILSSPQHRLRYDTTGQETEAGPDNRQAEAAGLVAGMLEAVMAESDHQALERTDLVALMRGGVERLQADCAKTLKNIDRDEKRTTSVLSRLTTTRADDPLGQMLNRRLADFEIGRQNIARKQDVLQLATEILDGYAFRFDAPPQDSFGWPISATSSSTVTWG